MVNKISFLNLVLKSEMKLHLVSRRRFKYSTGSSNLPRPREGDLVYIPLVQNFFEITFVEHENDQAMFYTLGRGRGGNVYVYALKMKQFVFSNEIIHTGIAEIDEHIRDNYTRSQLICLFLLVQEHTNLMKLYFNHQTEHLPMQPQQAIVHTWTKGATRKLDVYRVIGTFANASNTIGATSGAYYTTSGQLVILHLITMHLKILLTIQN
jgi:hypothetical protein